jgi:hypothetical protein
MQKQSQRDTLSLHQKTSVPMSSRGRIEYLSLRNVKTPACSCSPRERTGCGAPARFEARNSNLNQFAKPVHLEKLIERLDAAIKFTGFDEV